MIHSLLEMHSILYRLLNDTETEVVEFKEAKQNFNIELLGKYFSALSNEANLRNAECGWLIFGISDKRELCGTAYRKETQMPSRGLRSLKHTIAEHLNNGMTFEEIYEFILDEKRVIAFQIPPAEFAKPTTWRGIPWSREDSSLTEMPTFKVRAITAQLRPDWSGQAIFQASLDDLDPNALDFACKRYTERLSHHQELLEQFSQEDLLAKMGLLRNGHPTNAALVLLGKASSVLQVAGVSPRITWTLYTSDNTVETYEHFDPPFILQVDAILSKIRNEKYRFFSQEETLFPVQGNKYDTEVIRELLHNAIAHQDYTLNGKINILEFEDRLVFTNEGAFIPGSIEETLQNGYKPPYYRNLILTHAMSCCNMIDQNAIGIRNVYEIQRRRLLPLPTYDLSQERRVSVSLYGRVLDPTYTELLFQEPDLELSAVFLLDLVQKHIPIKRDQAQFLRKRGLIEGRYPHLTISNKVANIIGSPGEYIRQKGLDTSICKELIVKLLRVKKSATRSEIVAELQHALPETLDEEQKSKRVGNLLQELRKEHRVRSIGSRRSAQWELED